jgi:anhydro-N-acetylmuramic acid kinase
VTRDRHELFVGLISGTSADGIDAALVRFEPRAQVLAALTHPYPADLRAEIIALSRGDAAVALDHIAALDVRIGIAFADAARALLAVAGTAPDSITAIGSHGQTLRHRPRANPPNTLQLGDPSTIAERCRIAVVADFRRRDVAAGGQGAPLAPAFHAATLRVPHEDRAVLNLGGIANLTLLPAAPDAPVLGFDTGPASCLIDATAQREFGVPCDRDGAHARSGRVDSALLERCLAYEYFDRGPPKSTGREEFDLAWLNAHGPLPQRAEDLLATLTELTAASVAAAVRRLAPQPARVIACGGGVHNTFLMQRLASALAPTLLETTAAHGIDPDFVEAALFAWLARESLAGRPGNLPSVTGAAGARVLGAIYPA